MAHLTLIVIVGDCILFESWLIKIRDKGYIYDLKLFFYLTNFHYSWLANSRECFIWSWAGLQRLCHQLYYQHLWLCSILWFGTFLLLLINTSHSQYWIVDLNKTWSVFVLSCRLLHWDETHKRTLAFHSLILTYWSRMTQWSKRRYEDDVALFINVQQHHSYDDLQRSKK